MRVDGAFVQPLMDFSRALDRELSELLVQSLLRRMRHALLEGQTLEAPGIGEFTVRQRDPYALVNPINGQTRELGGERTILFRPDRQLLRELNTVREGDDVGNAVQGTGHRNEAGHLGFAGHPDNLPLRLAGNVGSDPRPLRITG